MLTHSATSTGRNVAECVSISTNLPLISSSLSMLRKPACRLKFQFSPTQSTCLQFGHLKFRERCLSFSFSVASFVASLIDF